MRIRSLLTTGLVLAFLGTAAFAQKGPGNSGPGCFWKDMKLTTEQQEKLKALHDEMQETRKQHKDQVVTVRKKITDELLKDAPSTANLDIYSKELGDLHVKMTQQRYKHLLKVKEVLTAEQFKSMLARHGGDENCGHKKGMGPANCHSGKQAGGCCAKGDGMKKHCGSKGTVE